MELPAPDGRLEDRAGPRRGQHARDQVLLDDAAFALQDYGKLLDQVLPAGVVNIVSGRGARTGQAMLDHPGFDKLAFTGSTEVGYSVAEAAAKRLIPSTLELGGKSANIIFDDAQLDKAIEGARSASSSTRVRSAARAPASSCRKASTTSSWANSPRPSRRIKVAIRRTSRPGWAPRSTNAELSKILGCVEEGVSEGARVLVGGARASEKGAFMQPTLLVDVPTT